MATLFQHGTANRIPQYKGQFASAMSQSNTLTMLKAELRELVGDAEYDAINIKIRRDNPGPMTLIERLSEAIKTYKLMAQQENDTPIDVTPLGGW